MRYACRLLALLCALIASSSESTAQFSTEEGIRASGSAAVPVRPERMRLRIELVAGGESILDSLAKLKIVKERCGRQMDRLKPLADSVRFDAPGIKRNVPVNEEAADDDVPEKPPGAEEAPAPRRVVASMPFTADWTLKSTDPADLAIEIATLQQVITDADLSKRRGADDDADEVNEEDNPFGVPTTAPGLPQFLFVGRLPLEEQQKCAARAFTRARHDAEVLAHGAGVTLKRLRSLRSPSFLEEGTHEFFTPEVSTASGLLRDETAKKKEEEVWGKDWRALEYRTRIIVSFDVAEP